jgi:hypothetical protein
MELLKQETTLQGILSDKAAPASVHTQCTTKLTQLAQRRAEALAMAGMEPLHFRTLPAERTSFDSTDEFYAFWAARVEAAEHNAQLCIDRRASKPGLPANYLKDTQSIFVDISRKGKAQLRVNAAALTATGKVKASGSGAANGN